MTTTVTRIPSPDPDTMRCPNCGGKGHNSDGSSSYVLSILPNGDHEVTTYSRPSTVCAVCKGKGRVRISPLEDKP